MYHNISIYDLIPIRFHWKTINNNIELPPSPNSQYRHHLSTLVKTRFVLKNKNTKLHTYMHTHPSTYLPHLQVAYIFKRRWRLMGRLRRRLEQGYFKSRGYKQSQKRTKREQRRMQRDKKSMSVTSWPHSAPLLSLSLSEQQTFPQLVYCGGIGRRVCLFLINPLLNYRAEGKCRTASARISPNEPPPFLSPASRPLPSLPVCFLFLAAPVSVSLAPFHASANQILGRL